MDGKDSFHRKAILWSNYCIQIGISQSDTFIQDEGRNMENCIAWTIDLPKGSAAKKGKSVDQGKEATSSTIPID